MRSEHSVMTGNCQLGRKRSGKASTFLLVKVAECAVDRSNHHIRLSEGTIFIRTVKAKAGVACFIDNFAVHFYDHSHSVRCAGTMVTGG